VSFSADSKEIERRASLYHDDGLLDIALGLALLLFGLAMILDQTALVGVYVVLTLPAVMSAKRAITVPRMPYVDFTPAPQAERAMARVALMAAVAGAVLLTLGLLAFGLSGALPVWLLLWMRAYALVLFGMLVAGLLSVIGWVLGVGRLYGYAALMAVAFVSGHILDLATPLYVTALGAVILACAIAVLVRFVRRYPG
jgi:hypothetical protein